ncbi:MAG TPA: hypothetical protein DCG47_08240 [Spirochaetaceae bacterium]|jgi:uncharacterized integral membrane protein|nr:hypothetical protein [Spirochaetaceae bacterium]
MPWKLLAFIATMTLVLVFVGFNLENGCDISIVFITFRQVPVVITILASFVLGLLAAFFLSLGKGRKGGLSKKTRLSATRDSLRVPGRGDEEAVSSADHFSAPSAGGKKPRSRAKQAPSDKAGGSGSPDTQ